MDRREMEARRADNQVWNGAGDYRLRPWYRAIGPDGQAPVYLNTIVGLAQREGWSGSMDPLLRSFAGSAREALYSDLFWMGVERCLALRWQEERPALQMLRRDYAAQDVYKRQLRRPGGGTAYRGEHRSLGLGVHPHRRPQHG